MTKALNNVLTDVTERIKTMASVLNDYFFDVDPDEGADVLGACLFYGACVFAAGMGITFGTLAIFY